MVKKQQPTPPRLIHTASLWTLIGQPSIKREWSLDRKAEEAGKAGFKAINGAVEPGVGAVAEKHGLEYVGYFSSAKMTEFRPAVEAHLKENVNGIINVQLGDHDTSTARMLKMALALKKESERAGVQLLVEEHRDTGTETPEKTRALADAYKKETGAVLPMTCDHSHPAVIKHLVPGNFSERLLDRPDLVQHSPFMHIRPFNGHHCQVPVTDGKGRLSDEFKAFLPFVHDLFVCWLNGPRPGNTLYVVPELGPIHHTYGLSCFPNVWEDAKRARKEYQKAWTQALKTVGK
ncbi:MAG: xylose isomerase [Opitutales bacterium]